MILIDENRHQDIQDSISSKKGIDILGKSGHNTVDFDKYFLPK